MEGDDYLPLSSIHDYAFCPRRWALVHIERQWQDNALTVEGELQHSIAHDEKRRETRGDLIISRGMRVLSHALRLQGVCDVVEFYRDPAGISLYGREGLWRPYPVEYKHGSAGIGTPADALQLCCQAICLEEMLLCGISSGALFYRESSSRCEIRLDAVLRQKALDMAREMNALFARGHTPAVRRKTGCPCCSLKDLCLPGALCKKDVAHFIRKTLQEVEPA